jgi:hypothetical protein
MWVADFLEFVMGFDSHRQNDDVGLDGHVSHLRPRIGLRRGSRYVRALVTRPLDIGLPPRNARGPVFGAGRFALVGQFHATCTCRIPLETSLGI